MACASFIKTEAEELRRISDPTKIISEQKFLTDVDTRRPPAEGSVVRQMISWANSNRLTVGFTMGVTGSTFVVVIEKADRRFDLLLVLSDGLVFFDPKLLKTHPPFFKDHQRLAELRRRLESIHVFIPSDMAPSVPLAILTKPAVLTALIATLDWVVQEINEM